MKDSQPSAECHCLEGWICEEHTELPWPHQDCAGPGTRCSNPECPWWKGGSPAALNTADIEVFESRREEPRPAKPLN